MATNYGLWTGVGEGLSRFGQGLQARGQRLDVERDKQVAEYDKQLQDMAANVVQLGGPQAHEAQSTVQEMYKLMNVRNAMFQPHETPLLIRSIQRAFGRTPAAPTPDPRQTTVDRMIAAAPLTSGTKEGLEKQMADAANMYVIAHRGEKDAQGNVISDQELMRLGRLEFSDKFFGGRGAAGQPKAVYMVSPDGKDVVELNEKDMDSVNTYLKKGWRKQEKPPAKYNQAIVNPDPISKAPASVDFQGKRWYPTEKDNWPEEVATAFQNATTTHETAVTDKINQGKALAQAKFDYQVKLKREQFKNQMALKNYVFVLNDLKTEQTLVDNARRQRETMQSSLVEWITNRNQQALINIVSNHLAMTAGGTKNFRINQALWNEAIASAPWLDNLTSKWGLSLTKPDGTQKTIDEFMNEASALVEKNGIAAVFGLSGVTVPDVAVQQMVSLAETKAAQLEAEQNDKKRLYLDVTKQSPTVFNQPTDQAPATPTTPTAQPPAATPSQQDQDIQRILDKLK